ncbi:Retrovirus-related Pol polyprotein from transposon TNT 1-94 [Gossypium australe]|uniref:Retrovirus-related Pol polyprotein from transposon TNT 1-94 n=1 Tax=Gossypium australe TaxID=47621 RepID=A0A5B6UY47_9ROSI|nr:Retrovirus-related Pol polyprotein from transposon TNT 1-94 [Gossypium australe]
MARVMLNSKDVAHKFWVEAINTTIYVIYRVHLRLKSQVTPCKLWKGRKPSVRYFLIFGSTYFILKDREYQRKFDSKSDECVFLGYAINGRTYRVYNKRTQKVMDSINVIEDDPLKSLVKAVVLTSSDHSQMDNKHTNESKKNEDEIEIEDHCDEFDLTQPTFRVRKNHSTSDIIGDIHDGVQTRGKPKNIYQDMVRFACYTSQFEPKCVEEALEDAEWIQAMQDEL